MEMGNPDTPADSAYRRCACGAALAPGALYCGACGAVTARICAACLGSIPEGDVCCPTCGAPREAGIEPTCRQCRTPVLSAGHFCPGCGTPLYHFCSGCGARRLESWAFCPFCGKKSGVPGRLAQAAAVSSAPVRAAAAQTTDQEAATDAEGWNARGAEAYEAERYDEAIDCFRRASEAAPDQPLYIVNLANACAGAGQEEEAESLFREALKRSPGDPNALLSLGYFYNEWEREEEAVETWQRLIQVAPNSDEAREARETLRQMGV